MLSTYRAVLKGDTLEWRNEKPKHIKRDKAVDVHVTILEETPDSPITENQGQRMADALEQLARLQEQNLPEDPAVWEREIRQDRVLPDRDN